MALSAEDWKAISDVLVNRVENVVDERMDRMETALAAHTADQSKRLSDHEQRIAALEGVKKKALIVWTFLVATTTFAINYVYETWIKPAIGQK